MNKSDNILKSHELRVTPVRSQVLEVFLESDVALSNQDIELEFDNLDRITLYRTLKAFEDKGIIHKAIDGTSVAKYALCDQDCNVHHHHDEHIHFHCNSCGNTFCVDEIKVPEIPTPTGFQITSMNIVMNGTCEKCA